MSNSSIKAYVAQYREWKKETDIKAGDHVLIVAGGNEHAYAGNVVTDDMEDMVGSVGVVKAMEIFPQVQMEGSKYSYGWPFWCLVTVQGGKHG